MADIFFGASEAEAVGAGVSRAHPKKWLYAEKTSQIRVYLAHAKRALAVRKNIRDVADTGITAHFVRLKRGSKHEFTSGARPLIPS